MATDERLKKESSSARSERDSDDRSSQQRVISDDDRLEMFRKQFYQDALPDLPKIEGYHVCWLTTSNPRDSIHQRIRMGYEPIKSSDLPGYEFYNQKTGEYAGLIGMNEMLAFKIRMELYQKYMWEAHERIPAEEESRITAVIDEMQEQAQSQGAQVYQDEGYQSMRQGPRRVVFDG